MTNWTASANPAEVMPINDLKAHVSGMDCWYKPVDDDGVIVHNSVDGRELYEGNYILRKPIRNLLI